MTVYFIRSENFVKIGYSSKPMARVRNLQTANPNQLEILCLVPGSAATEKQLHSVFSELHHLNEWYRYEDILVEYIKQSQHIFSDYTAQYETGETYQDEQDWEYWKARALAAEIDLLKNNVANQNNTPVSKSISGKALEIYNVLLENPNASNTEIGGIVGTSGQYVGRIRSKLNGIIQNA